jgi:hypothetical protein
MCDCLILEMGHDGFNENDVAECIAIASGPKGPLDMRACFGTPW